MQTRLDPAGLRPLVPGGGPSVADPRQAAFQRNLAPMVGKTVQGEVLAKIPDGSYLVRVADTNARMVLPGGTQVGAQVALNVVAAQPRPLLQVGTEQAQPATVYTAPGEAGASQARPMSSAAVLLNKAPLVAADQLPKLDHTSAQATLSPAARAIASALTQAYTAPGAPVVIHGRNPLVAAGAPDPERIELALKNVLGESGLFYESHVAEWAEGKRSLQDLAREPQMQRMTQQASSEALARAMGGPDLSAAQMINLQLHAQEQGKVQWHGEAWPGQKMQWEVEREENEGRSRGRGEADEQPVWRSGMRFSLPLLGKVAATITLVGDQVHVAMQSGTDDTAAELRAWSGALQRALEAADAPLASLTIGTGAGAGADTAAETEARAGSDEA
ncbi:flagellar hook-length control protein FliK [Pseudoduganella lutea]|uniref:Flagellar hook-length control protein FliK n=1 Tax=Pseudoduganella lutea TaxID=321985 RepID=A0A4P6L1U4_9BURK|nr:flagellar hook-length control protein FliK [Pseudoduganella lutea]QBE64852.1 flagellar hook-length control protein FliK [Pseudoduganella lutea]